MKIVAIVAGKIVLFFGRILKRGSSLPGKVALKIDKNLLSKLKYPNVRIAITGSSGKGSTSSLIANTLKENGYKVCFNNSGSNLKWGITTSLIKSSSLFGKIKSDYLVLEIDERYAKKIFKDIKPSHLVITNITKDQPPRQFNVDVIYEELLNSITDNTTIVTNMDDPYLRNFERDLDNDFIYYSIDKNKYSYKKQIFENLNTYFCPICGAYLNYDYYNFETLGKYSCSKCDFKYNDRAILGKKLDLENGTLEINNEKMLIGGDMLYQAYNTIAAYTLLNSLDINFNIIDSINKFNSVSKAYFTNNSKDFYGLSTKAENATTYNSAIFKVINDSRPKDVIIGWKEISRRYNHFDVSWLYDVEFELINNKTLNKVYACGIDSENIKKRLILAGIEEDKIVTASNIVEIKDEVMNDQVDVIYGVLNFDYIEPFNNTFKEV